MPAFRYKAVDSRGEAVAGTMEAENLLGLERLLLEIDYWLVEANPVANHQNRGRKVSVSRRELIEFCSAMSAMLDAGIPVIDAMQTMTEETANLGLREVLQDLSVNLEAGVSLTAAMERHPAVFAKQITNIVKAGEYSGNLGTSFSEVMRHLEWLDALIADLKQVSIYPASVLVTVGLFVLLLFGFVVPTFTGLLEELGMRLPLITRLVMSAGDLVGAYWYLFLGLPVAGWFVLASAYRKSESVALAIDRAKLGIPIFGPLIKMVCLSRFSHNMAMLMRSGVPMLQALSLTTDLVGNRLISRAVREAEVAVNEGQTMTSALRQYSVFSPMLMRMLVVGEETGTMENSLEHISRRFDEDIPRRIKRVMSLLEPAIVLSLIALVGTVALAIFLPFMQLLGGIV
ncbi:MAG: type II secretion system F family protein [Pseudomonadota bacterium]